MKIEAYSVPSIKRVAFMEGSGSDVDDSAVLAAVADEVVRRWLARGLLVIVTRPNNLPLVRFGVDQADRFWAHYNKRNMAITVLGDGAGPLFEVDDIALDRLRELLTIPTLGDQQPQ